MSETTGNYRYCSIRRRVDPPCLTDEKINEWLLFAAERMRRSGIPQHCAIVSFDRIASDVIVYTPPGWAARAASYLISEAMFVAGGHEIPLNPPPE